MDQNEAHRLRLEVIEAGGRARMAEQRERFARAEADRCRLALRGLRDALLAMIDVDVLGDNYRTEQAQRENP